MKNALSLVACWLALLVCASFARQLPPSQPPTFRIGIDAVQLDVSVLDAERRPVRGLTAADFTVLDDGTARRIVQFAAVELPREATAPSSFADGVPPDVVRNDLPEGRLVVILLDPFLERVMVDQRVTIADPPGLAALRATALRVVDSLGPGDLAAVAHTMYGISQNFTTDKSRLKRAIDTSAYGTNKRAEGLEWGNCNCGTCRVEAITRVATALRNEPQRRKSVFFIGERVPLAPVTGGCNTYLEPATKALVQATELANVTVHTIDPNSLETTNIHAGDDFKPQGSFGSVSAAARAQEEANRAHLIERHDSLQTIADWTGGRAILNTNRPEESVRPILDESSSYYLLAFETSDIKLDGRFHPVTVKVNRPDVQVRSRRGFYAERTSAALRSAPASFSVENLSRSLLPERGLPMSIAAVPFRGSSGTPIVLITTGVRNGAAARRDSASSTAAAPRFEPIEILTSAFRDGEKKTEWQRQRVSIAIPDGGPADDLRYESVSTLSLAPGTYEVRVASRNERTDMVGSVHTYVDVPDFNSQPLMLSGLVLLDSRAPIVTPAAALAGVLDGAPTTRREFSMGADVSALVRVYHRSRDTSQPVTVTFRVLGGAGEAASSQRLLGAEQFANGNAADARYRLPLTTLKSGVFVLRVEASDNRTSIHRELRFTVK